MLAGIVISVVVVAGLLFGLPLLNSRHQISPDAIDGDLAERFSDSMRILRRDVADYVEELGTDVSTPLTRRAELTELRLLARAAAARRARTLAIILVAVVGVGVAAALGYLPPWSPLVPAGLLLTFVVAARIGVRAMQRRFDARARRTDEGWGDEEETTVIAAPEAEALSSEFSIDLTPPVDTGVLWDPVQVITPTYMSKPLVPRTVRTIDLSAPLPESVPLVPTADPLGERPDEVPDEVLDGRGRAVGE